MSRVDDQEHHWLFPGDWAYAALSQGAMHAVRIVDRLERKLIRRGRQFNVVVYRVEPALPGHEATQWWPACWFRPDRRARARRQEARAGGRRAADRPSGPQPETGSITT